MNTKTDLKKEAVALRKRGKVYSEILSQVPVAKSTLSLWLRDVGLAKAQKQRITKKRREAQMRGAKAKRFQRIERQRVIQLSAQKEVGEISRRELWLVGVSLYWAEGSKEKEYKPGAGVQFGNSDPRMIRFFLRWLHSICKVEMNQIWFEVYLHESHRFRKDSVVRYWSKELSVPIHMLGRVYYKKGNIKTKRRNSTIENYFGLVRVRVRKSSTLLRRISGWTDGIVVNSA